MKKTNNKGFSLVELIIVIAIMAVLIGVLAPQFIKYVEDARLQKDNSAIGEVANAMKIAATDEAVNAILPEVLTFTGGAGTPNAPQVLTLSATGTALEKALVAVVGTEIKTTSNTYKEGAVLTISIDADGKVTAANFIEKQKTTAISKVF